MRYEAAARDVERDGADPCALLSGLDRDNPADDGDPITLKPIR